jgi:hypothetical protein
MIRHLESKLDTAQKTGIFCVAMRMNGDMYFKNIPDKPKISEYIYDDVFSYSQNSTNTVRHTEHH